MTELLAVVVLGPEDPADPTAPAARRMLGGVSLADRAVHLLNQALPGSQVITSVLERALADLMDPAETHVVLLHDPAFPFLPAGALRAVCAAVDPIAGDQVAAVAVTDVTDTLKRVDDAGRVLATEDRHSYRAPVGLLAVTPAVLGAVLSSAWREGARPRGLSDLVDLVAALDRVVGVGRVELPGLGSSACRVVDEDSLAYAEAVLAASTRSATATSSG